MVQARPLTLKGWSPSNRAFVDDVTAGGPVEGQPVHCRPSTSGFPSASALRAPILWGGRQWSIAGAYAPRFHGGEYPSLLFYAAGPEFRPLPSVKCSPTTNGFIVRLRPDPTLDIWAVSGRLEVSTHRQGGTYFIRRDVNGRLTDLVTCLPGTAGHPGSCQNNFRRNGVEYYFRHAVAGEPEWRRLQEALVRRVDGFQSAPGDNGGWALRPLARPR
jgi:hypothetical protein